MTPSRTFRIGDQSGPADRDAARWDWFSEWGADDEVLLAHFLEVFSPHIAVLQDLVAADVEAGLAIVGTVAGVVVSTREQADRLRVAAGENDPLRPIFHGDRVALILGPDVVRFLGAIGTTITTHIDVELIDDPPVGPGSV